MEWLTKRSLKQSFFIISTLFLSVGLLLAGLSFAGCVELRSHIENYAKYELSLNENGNIDLSEHTAVSDEDNAGANAQVALLTVLQFALPVIFVVFSLVLAAVTFYRFKLKHPLAVLQDGAERIRRQDLDFTLEQTGSDELGALCAAFETMRVELLNNNRELWRQMEERKRLNAAFAHDLRNPVTVLKGSALVLQKSLTQKTLTTQSAGATIDLITQYAGRIETYLCAMTSAQKLEELRCMPQPVLCSALYGALESGLSVLGADKGKDLQISHNGMNGELWADQSIVQNVAENLVCNALRYAKTAVAVELAQTHGRLLLTVSDDGPGFSPVILQKGASPFLRGDDATDGEHFGMGLYISRLLLEKHGGMLTLENTQVGAKATAIFDTKKP